VQLGALSLRSDTPRHGSAWSPSFGQQVSTDLLLVKPRRSQAAALAGFEDEPPRWPFQPAEPEGAASPENAVAGGLSPPLPLLDLLRRVDWRLLSLALPQRGTASRLRLRLEEASLPPPATNPSLLLTAPRQGVRDYLCNRLYSLEERRVETYLAQLVAHAVAHPSPCLERLLLDFCSRSLRLGVKVRHRRRAASLRRCRLRSQRFPTNGWFSLKGLAAPARAPRRQPRGEPAVRGRLPSEMRRRSCLGCALAFQRCLRLALAHSPSLTQFRLPQATGRCPAS